MNQKERREKTVTVKEIGIEEIRMPHVKLTVTCSKGTYVRSLLHDMGEALGCGGCMEQLVRTRVGRFAVEDALTLNEIQSRAEAGKLSEILLTPDSFFYELPGLSTDSKYDRLLHNPVEDAITIDADIVFLEGNYLLLDMEGWRGLSAYADYTISITADEELLRERLVTRRIATGVERKKAEKFVDFSDMANVRLCLEKTMKADLGLALSGTS